MSKLPPRDRLQAAADVASAAPRNNAGAAEAIAILVRDHGGTHSCRPTTNTLRVCGVAATCTWSETTGLLEAWRRNATLRLLKLDGKCA